MRLTWYLSVPVLNLVGKAKQESSKISCDCKVAIYGIIGISVNFQPSSDVLHHLDETKDGRLVQLLYQSMLELTHRYIYYLNSTIGDAKRCK